MAKKFSSEWWQAQRPEVVGKATEELVLDILKEENRRVDFAFHRLPDAKSARGALAAQPADTLIVDKGLMAFLEIKALRHSFRLTKDRVSQLPTLHKFEAAGAVCLILCHHYMDGIWRIINARDLDASQPSWDLRHLKVYTNPRDAIFGAK